MDIRVRQNLVEWAEKYNDNMYFSEDPIIFPKHFAKLLPQNKARRQDVEVAAIFASHLAWGRRAMIVRDTERLLNEMDWRPYDYVMNGEYRNDPVSIHRTIKWCDIAAICSRLKVFYSSSQSLGSLTVDEIRCNIFGQKSDPKAANKKINMMRRWLVRNDGKVDLGLWTELDPKELIVPLDVHVHQEATSLGLTSAKSKNLACAKEITDAFREIWPQDPLKGDFALFGYGIAKNL